MVFTRSACRPGAVRWIDLVFGDCIYSGSELGSFLVGLLGIGLWVIAQMPQALENFRNQSAEGLSIWFLLQWLLGDSLNLLGCVVQGEQLLTTTLLAVYFVASDVVLLGQYWWYEGLQRLLGTALGYAMVVVYLSSRLPQIHKNWVRKLAEGLSLSMFLLAGTANVCTSLSIVLRSESWQSFIVQLPWFLGSIGTVGLDAFIIYQACLYAQPAARQPAWLVGDVCPDRQDGEDEERGGQAGVGKGTEQGRAMLSRDTGELGTMSEPLLEASKGQAKV